METNNIYWAFLVEVHWLGLFVYFANPASITAFFIRKKYNCLKGIKENEFLTVKTSNKSSKICPNTSRRTSVRAKKCFIIMDPLIK